MLHGIRSVMLRTEVNKIVNKINKEHRIKDTSNIKLRTAIKQNAFVMY